MSGIGKWLTFLNLFVALTMLSWAASVYVNQVPWVDRKTETEVVKGQITIMKEEIEKLNRSVNDTQGVYGTKVANLTQVEASRDYRQRKYYERIDQAKKGQFRLQLPMANDKAFVDLEREGNPILGPDNKPLRGVDALAKDFENQVKDAQMHRRGSKPVADWNAVKIEELLAADRLPDLGINDLRDLQGRVSDRVKVLSESVEKQKDILFNLRYEAEYLGDQRVNWIVQLQTLERRQRQLEERLRQFGAPPAGSGSTGGQ